SLLMAVELADLDLGPELGILDGHATQRDGLSEQRRARAAGDDAHPRAPDVDTIAVRGRLVTLQFEPDEGPLRMSLAAEQRLLAHEVVGLRGHREADPGLERVHLVIELAAGVDQAGLNPEDVERLQAQG